MDEYAFCLVSAQGGVIRSLFETLKDIVHDVSIVIDDSGLKVLTTDGVKQMLMSLKLRAQSFEKFHCSGTHRLGVNINAIFKLLRIATARDTVSMYAKKGATETLGIRISNVEKKSTTVFSMKLLDVNFADISVPDVEFDATATMPSAYFQRLCRDMSNIGQNLDIQLAGDGSTLTLGCDGDFASQQTVLAPIEDGKHVVTIERHGDNRDDLEGRYSLKYLSLFNKASSLSSVIEIFLKRNYPLVLRFAISNLGELKFALAAKQPV